MNMGAYESEEATKGSWTPEVRVSSSVGDLGHCIAVPVDQCMSTAVPTGR